MLILEVVFSKLGSTPTHGLAPSETVSTAPSLPPFQFMVCTSRFARSRFMTKKAENGGLDPSWLDLAFWGAPIFSLEVSIENTCFKGYCDLRTERKMGAPQKRQIQSRRIQPPILGSLSL